MNRGDNRFPESGIYMLKGIDAHSINVVVLDPVAPDIDEAFNDLWLLGS